MTSSSFHNNEQDKVLPSKEQLSAGGRRVLAAIRWIKKPYTFDLTKLDEKDLAQIAHLTNSAGFHCTPNCPLVSAALFYNLKIGKTLLSVKNIFPIYKPIGSSAVEEVFFGYPNYLMNPRWDLSISNLETELIEVCKKYHERVFMVGVDYSYKFLGKPVGHCFNAVVLGDENTSPKVIFVDAWKTHKCIYTIDEIKKRYSSMKNKFKLQIYPTPLLPFMQAPKQNKRSFRCL